MKICTINLFFITLCCLGQISAQEFILKQDQGKKLNIANLESSYLDWTADKALDQAKEWKWYGRWLEHQIQRSSSSGAWPNNEVLFNAAIQVAEIKMNDLSQSSNGWMPVGPEVIPHVPQNRLIHGLGRINTVAFHPTDSTILFVGVAQGGLWKTSNSGQSWMPLTDQLPIIRISDIAIDPSDTDNMYICIGDYAYLGSALDADARKRNTHYGLGVYKSTDGGQTWNPTGLNFNQKDKDGSLMRRVFIDPSNSQRLVAAGISGVHISTDGGDTWTTTLNEVMADIKRDPSNHSVLYASSHNVREIGLGRPAIWKSIDQGLTWIELNSGLSNSDIQRIEIAISPSNTSIIYAIACDLNGGLFGFYRSDDAGMTWRLRAQGPNILHWYSGGSQGGQGTYDLSIVVDATDPDRVYTGGINMWGTEDGGLNWKRASFWLPDYGPSLHADHHQYKYNPVDRYYYACHDGGINRTRKIYLYEPSNLSEIGFEFETQWEDLTAGMEITSFYRMDIGRINGDLIAGAQDNSTFYLRDTQWANVVLGDGMDCFFHPTDGNTAYTSTQGGRFVRLRNRGDNSSFSLTSDITAIETGGWTTPFEQDPFQTDGIYAAFGNVWKSDDRGDSWSKLTDFASIGGGSSFILPASTMSISESDANRFYVAKRIYPTLGLRGEFWTTSDGGFTMENITAGLPDSLFITASTTSDFDAARVWVTFGGFADGLKVFRSDNAGVTWNNASFNLPNIPINAIEFVKGSLSNTVYIGTDVGIYVTNDDLAEWMLFSTQLPNVIVTDLVIDEAKNEIYASTFGRGIWKNDLAIISSTGEIQSNQIEIDVYPSPNSGQFSLLSDADVTSIEIVNINGRTVYNDILMHQQGLLEYHFDLDLAPGLYFLKVKSDKGKGVVRFVVN